MHEKVSKLIRLGVVDISDGFPAQDGDEYFQLLIALLRAGVSRMPIIGFKSGSDLTTLTTLMLVSNQVQEHKQLVGQAGIAEPAIAYTTSIEGIPSSYTNYTNVYAYYLKIIAEEQERYQKIGPGSDYYRQSLNNQGIAELTRIFQEIGVLSRVFK